MAKMGRPTKLTPQTQAKIVQAIRIGNYVEVAASYAGINKTTVYDWMKRGEREKQRVEANPRAKIRKAEEPYVDFSNAIEQAMTESEMNDLAATYKTKDWKAASWRLERKFPDRWGKKDNLKLEGDLKHEHEGEVKVNHDVFAKIDEYASLFESELDDE